MVGALFVVDAVWLAFRHDGSALVTLQSAAVVMVLLAVAGALAVLSFAIKRLARPLIVASDFIDSIVYVFVFGAFLAPFTSLLASLDLPLIDRALNRADHLLGFDWSSASDWVARHVMLDREFTRAYYCCLWQAPFVLRGIVPFPSVHAVLAVIYIYCGRHRIWALLVRAPLNLLMLASTPTVGGHYLVDVLAGIAIAFASIGLARAFQHRSVAKPPCLRRKRV